MTSKPAVGIELSLLNDIELVRTGDLEAFARLIDRTSTTVTSIALAIVRDIDNAEDVAQQVYIKVWQKIRTLKKTTSFLPWLRQTTRNTAFNFLRDNKKCRTISGEPAERLLNEFSDPNQNQEDLLLRTQQSAILTSFVDALPNEDREVILLYYREGESTKQVAELLNISEANVRKKLSRTRASLKTKMLAKCGDLLIATAPAIGFGNVLVSSITASSPVAAVTIASTSTSKVLPWGSKMLLLLGSGAMLSAVGAIGAIFLGSKFQLRNIGDPDVRQKLIRRRNGYFVFLLVFGIAFAMSYEFTKGWLAPFVCYSIFALSLINFVIVSNKVVIDYHGNAISNNKKNAYKRWQTFFGSIGLIGGLGVGFAGLILGLINSGRLIL